MPIESKLAELGLALPEAMAPVAAYVPVVIAGNLAHVSGQISIAADGTLLRGRLGDDMDVAAGQEAARRSALMIVAQLKKAVGDLAAIKRIVKLGVFVQCTPDFTDQPEVANGASELLLALFGEAGRHARAAVGVPALPRGVAVEVDAVVELR